MIGHFPHALERLQRTLRYRFKRLDLLVQSLTHASFFKENPNLGNHNQRLEFLGDAIISAVITEKLFQLFPNEREGILSRYRSALCNGEQLAEIANKLEIYRFLRIGKSEDKNCRQLSSVLEDALEAIAGAIYLDSDFDTTRQVVLHWYDDIKAIVKVKGNSHNPKGQLQEMVQPHLGNQALEYRVIKESGPDHDKTFEVQLLVNGIQYGRGEGTSKKEAEENVARIVLAKKLLFKDLEKACLKK